MIRAEPRFKAIESALDRQSRAWLLLITRMNTVSPQVQSEVDRLNSEIDTAQIEREGKRT